MSDDSSLGLLTACVFAALALLHVYRAAGGGWGRGAAVAVIDCLHGDLRALEELWLDKLPPFGERGYDDRPTPRVKG